MWTKEDLRGKYIKINSEEDYSTVISVLHELGIKQLLCFKDDVYNSKYNSLFVTYDFYYFLTESKHDNIPIQQFYDYLASKPLKVEDLIEGEIYVGKHTIYKWNGKSNNLYRIFRNTFHKDDNPYWDVNSPDRIADSEEKKHLEVCIKQDKFILKEDLHLYDDITFELKFLQNKPQFEVGKWYSFNWDFHSKTNGKTIIKVKEVTTNGVISEARIYLYRQGDVNFTNEDEYEFADISNVKELSIEEIQQYLPDGHPDKIKSMEKNGFKKDDYIVLLKGGNNPYLDKDSYFSNTCYKLITDNYFSTYLDSKGLQNGWSCVDFNDPFGLSNNNVSWRYATPEEIAEYDRLGKPYDVTTLKNKVKEWSIGTYVVGIKGYFGLFSEGNSEDKKLPIGKIFTIKNSLITEIAVKESIYWIYKSNLKWFATKEEAEEFAKTLNKPKDYVIGIDPHNVGIYPVYEKDIEPIKEYSLTLNEAFQQEGLIDTTVNKIQSVSVELYQPEELQLF